LRRLLAPALAGLAAATAAPAAAETVPPAHGLACQVHDPPEGGRLATCLGRAHPSLPHWRFVLVGAPPDRVARIDIYEEGRDLPRQTLDAAGARPDMARLGRAFVLEDVNFDRRADLRLALAAPGAATDAEGIAYRWWIFDAGSTAFIPTTALDGIRDPRVNPHRKLIVGTVVDRRGRRGEATYRWRDGALTPVGAWVIERGENGACTRHHYVRDGEAWRKVREQPCAVAPVE
jgi:hypothetical protein